jgi:uncharacterized membrane protein (Fun14 family)
MEGRRVGNRDIYDIYIEVVLALDGVCDLSEAKLTEYGTIYINTLRLIRH